MARAPRYPLSLRIWGCYGSHPCHMWDKCYAGGMRSRHISLRLEDGMLAWIDAYAEVRRWSRTTVIEAAVEALMAAEGSGDRLRADGRSDPRSTPAPIRGQTTVEEHLRMGHSTGRRPKT